jgi:hypothetical protein
MKYFFLSSSVTQSNIGCWMSRELKRLRATDLGNINLLLYNSFFSLIFLVLFELMNLQTIVSVRNLLTPINKKAFLQFMKR